MTKQIVCAVRDRAVDSFGTPFFVRHVNEAIRSFKDEVNRDGSTFKAHPDDYDLYSLGTYDADSGMFEPTTPVMLSVGKSVVFTDDPF